MTYRTFLSVLLYLALSASMAAAQPKIGFSLLTDEPDTSEFDGKASPPSLRAAIMHANQNPGVYIIEPVGISGSTIQLQHSLPGFRTRIFFNGSGIKISGANKVTTGSLMIIENDSCIVRNVTLMDNVNGGGLTLKSDGNLVEAVQVINNNGPGINLNDANGNRIGGEAIASNYFSNIIRGNKGTGGHGISIILNSNNNIISKCGIGLHESATPDSNSRWGIYIESSGTRITDNVISGNNYGGISIDRSTSSGTIIDSNMIGIDYLGNAAVPNRIGISITNCVDAVIRGNVVSGNSANAIFLGNTDAKNVTIENNIIGLDEKQLAIIPNVSGITSQGTNTVIRINVIAGNISSGIHLGSGNATVVGNRIGMNWTGDSLFKNTGEGIMIQFGSNHRIGGSGLFEGNYIGGNDSAGIHIRGHLSGNNVIEYNYIGTDPSGLKAYPNHNGIQITQGAFGNRISSNLISGNREHGILLQKWFNRVPHSDTISANLIGVNIAQTDSLPNGRDGIRVHNAENIVIGGLAEKHGNVIAGNRWSGIFMQGDTTTNCGIWSNYIGVTDDRFPMPNYHGVEIEDASNISVGGKLAGMENVIAYNHFTGVAVTANAQKVSVLRNAIYSNGELGIDLGNDGPDKIDAGDGDTGPNGRINFPQFRSSEEDGDSLLFKADYSGSPNSDYRIEAYYNPFGCDVSYHGEGQQLVRVMNITTDAQGTASFEFRTEKDQRFISLTATSSDGNTSEFSECTGGVVLPHNLEVTIDTDPEEPVVDRPFFYRVTVRNLGPAFAANVVLRDTLSRALQLVAANAADATVTTDDSIVVMEIPMLLSGESRELEIETLPLFTGTVLNTASAVGEGNDSDPSNNRALITTIIGISSVATNERETELGRVAYSHLYDPTIELTREGCTLAIYNVEGKLIGSYKEAGTRFDLSPYGLAPGYYTATITHGRDLQHLPFAILE
jgi:uncharacterized repeat protein (TIGR01451 family)